MSQITVGPPDLKEADKQAVAVANYLRYHELLKQRPALLNGQKFDFFRVKRAIRALQDPSYEKCRAKNPLLPELKSKQQCVETLAKLPLNRLGFNVQKLETDIALAQGLKPQSGVPCVVVSPQQRFEDDDYIVWFYNPVPLSTRLYGLAALLCVAAVVVYPLWPYRLRIAAYYLSLAALGFICFLLVLGVVRLILFVITHFAVPPGIWLFPNLFADVGFFDSFKPLYSWHGQKTLPKKLKRKKRVPTNSMAQLQEKLGLSAGAGGSSDPSGATSGSIASLFPQLRFIEEAIQSAGGGNQNLMKVIVQKILGDATARTQARLKEKLEKEPPKTQAEIDLLKQEIFSEELKSAQQQLQSGNLSALGSLG